MRSCSALKKKIARFQIQYDTNGGILERNPEFQVLSVMPLTIQARFEKAKSFKVVDSESILLK